MGFNIVTGSTTGTSTMVGTISTGFKASIVLADFVPGTRSITLPAGTYRVAVVGGGGGVTTTIGSGVGGTSSWAATHSATGGAASSAGGAGSGGDINTNGGSTAGAGQNNGGAASGHRLGSAPAHPGSATGGGGWSSAPRNDLGGLGLVDGFGLGLPPGMPQQYLGGKGTAAPGCGATTTAGDLAGLGGGGAGGGASTQAYGGPGGGGAGGAPSNYSGSGGGYAEKVITVAAPTAFSYTVGVGGNPFGGSGAVIVERLS